MEHGLNGSLSFWSTVAYILDRDELLKNLRPMPPFKKNLRQAIRDGRKTQTRRVIKPQPRGWSPEIEDDGITWAWCIAGDMDFSERIRCPYGKVGDIQCLREPLYHNATTRCAYYDDDMTPALDGITGEPIPWRWKREVLPQIFMPKRAARTFRRLAAVRAERLQDISESDAIAEGVSSNLIGEKWGDYKSARAVFKILWDSINAARGYPYTDNHWVWVLTYEEVK